MFSFDNRLANQSALWPREQAELLKDYLKSSNVYLLRDRTTHKLKEWPYWILLPYWLHNKWKSKNLLRVSYSIEDLLWAQFCVYLGIKINDDELDGQTKICSAGSVSELLFSEAEVTLANYFTPASDFWNCYYDYINLTNSAISKIDELQKNWSSETNHLEKEYNRLGSVLKIGTCSFFSVNKKQNEFEDADFYLDEMSVGGQILDDLFDYEEDMHSGKLNYASRILLNDSPMNFTKEEMILKISESIIRTNKYKVVLNLVRAHYNKAHFAAGIYNLEKVNKYHFEELERLKREQNKIHYKRVISVFGKGI